MNHIFRWRFGIGIAATTMVFLGGSAHANWGDFFHELLGEWRMYNHDPRGTRHNISEFILSPTTVPYAHQLWSISTAGVVASTPAVVDDTVYAGDASGAFYAVAADKGTVRWKTQVVAPIAASPTVVGNRVVFGDLGGFIYGLDRETGKIAWQIRPNSHPLAAIFGSGTLIGRHLAIGVASNEEEAAANPNYPCCSARGSVLLLDPVDGTVLWQTFTISDDEAKRGSSGASIWSSPTFDDELGLIYVTTGNNFSDPTTDKEDAFLALNARTGAIVWVNQRIADDSWTSRFPLGDPQHPDFDFGDSPQIYRLPSGKKVVGAGDKDGFYFVLDAATGALINQQQFEAPGATGGLFSDSAVADGIVYANGSNWPRPNPPISGDVIAFTGDASKELWRFSVPGSPNVSGVAVANRVVYFTSSFVPTLFALDAKTGNKLAALPLPLPSSSGPSVSRGRIYVGAGNPFAGFTNGAIVAFGL